MYYESESLFGLCGCRDDHKTQSMIVEVVHGGFGGAMVERPKNGRSSMKNLEIHRDPLSFSSSFLSPLLLSPLPHDLIMYILVVQIP